MLELLSKFEPGELIGLTAVVGGLLCGVVAIVMGIALEMRKAELATGLKKAMLERGMSAEEIRMVMDLSYKGTPSSCKQPAYEEV